MNNRIIEVEVNGQDLWQAIVGEEKLTFCDDETYTNYRCNLDEIHIVQEKLDDEVRYNVFSCDDYDDKIRDIAKDNLFYPGDIDGNYSSEAWIDGDIYLEHLISNSEDYELIWAINNKEKVHIKDFNLDKFVESGIDKETIKEVLIKSKLLIK